MTLQHAVARLATTDDQLVLCVREPWTPDSECVVASLDGEARVPSDVLEAGFSYFLEVHVANEVVKVFGDRSPSLEEQVRLLIDYAQNDAYPDWVYAR